MGTHQHWALFMFSLPFQRMFRDMSFLSFHSKSCQFFALCYLQQHVAAAVQNGGCEAVSNECDPKWIPEMPNGCQNA
jgi:hypothetical protein